MKPEIRSYTAAELRAADEDFCLEGYAASYNQLSQDLGGFREQIAPGAFSRSIKEGADVKCLLNHDPNFVLGRTKSGTLTLTDSRKGLAFRVALSRSNQMHCDIYDSVKIGNLSECSFAFSVPQGGDVWDEASENGKRFNRRTLKDVNLMDVSVVASPAYNAAGSTSVDARTADAAADAAIRSKAEAISRELEADFQRRTEAAGRAVAADRAAGEIE
jgi:HK97 family phage prohead protease